jgi:hypothetical protein
MPRSGASSSTAVGSGLGGEKFTTLAGLGAALMVTGTYWGQNIERAHHARSAHSYLTGR